MKFYQVQRYETICQIAKKFNTTCEEIIRLNDLSNITFIDEGDIIRIK